MFLILKLLMICYYKNTKKINIITKHKIIK